MISVSKKRLHVLADNHGRGRENMGRLVEWVGDRVAAQSMSKNTGSGLNRVA